MQKNAASMFKTAIIDSGIVFRFALGAGAEGFFLLSLRLKAVRPLAERWVAALDSSDSKAGRKAIYAQYKENRRGRLTESQQQCIREAMQKFKWFCQLQNITMYEAPGWEADDVVATWVAKPENRPALIVSLDKDLYQLLRPDVVILRELETSGLYRKEDLYEEFGVTPQEWATVLAFAGDPGDNVPGVRGIGIKKGIALVKKFGADVDYDDPRFALSKQLVTLRSDLDLQEVQEEPPEDFARILYKLQAIQEATLLPERVVL